MLVVYIERWKGTDGVARFPWSVWADGRRTGMGEASDNAEAAERQALAYCRETLGRAPDRIQRL